MRRRAFIASLLSGAIATAAFGGHAQRDESKFDGIEQIDDVTGPITDDLVLAAFRHAVLLEQRRQAVLLGGPLVPDFLAPVILLLTLSSPSRALGRSPR